MIALDKYSSQKIWQSDTFGSTGKWQSYKILQAPVNCNGKQAKIQSSKFVPNKLLSDK